MNELEKTISEHIDRLVRSPIYSVNDCKEDLSIIISGHIKFLKQIYISDRNRLKERINQLKAINYTHGCTELCECVEPFIEVTAEECSGCGMLIKGD